MDDAPRTTRRNPLLSFLATITAASPVVVPFLARGTNDARAPPRDEARGFQAAPASVRPLQEATMDDAPRTRRTPLLSFLTTITTASLVVTFLLALGANDARGPPRDEARSFRAPHLQAAAVAAALVRGANDTRAPPERDRGAPHLPAAAAVAPPDPSGSRGGGVLPPRRNLSETAAAAGARRDQRPSGARRNQRPSGVVYQ